MRGTEVKSLRQGRANLKDAYAQVSKSGEVILYQLHISEYDHGNINNHDPLRARRLLMHKHEIKRLIGKVKEKGFALVPLKLYFKHGFVKLELAMATGKHEYDKRQDIAKREAQREMDRAMKAKNKI